MACAGLGCRKNDRIATYGQERHGSNHDVYKHPSKPGRIVVARHRTLSVGVARVIAKTAGWID
jgi:hypothetical protein